MQRQAHIGDLRAFTQMGTLRDHPRKFMKEDDRGHRCGGEKHREIILAERRVSERELLVDELTEIMAYCCAVPRGERHWSIATVAPC